MHTTSGRALVLGGGGSTGNAWLVGVAAGLAEAGTDVTTADLTIGTSAGSTAAAHLVGGAPAERYASILGEQPPPQRPQGGLTSDHLDRLRAVIEASVDLPDYRRRSGAAALEMLAASDGSWQDRWRGIVAARLQGLDWPDRRVLITAVDAATGEPVELDRDSGVSPVDAVAASCAGGLPFRIGDRWYVDGGYRRNADNADLARGCARVLVLSPLGGRTLTPAAWGTHLAAQVDELRAAGSRVVTILPPDDSAHLLGANAMDVSLRPAAARAGYELGRSRADAVAALWA